jgi:lysophospholipase L1-like esterase
MRPALVFFVFLLTAVATGCGSDDDGSPATTATPDPTSTRQAARSTPAAVRSPTATAASAATPAADAPLYIALGDSLSHGVGATDREATAFVPLVHQGLGRQAGLLNLGHSGDDSEELIEHGHLHTAIAEIGNRNGDADPGNDVILVTLEVGGNDLLDLYFDLVLPGTCPNLTEGLQKPECVDGLRRSLDVFTPNLRDTLSRLREADPDLLVILMTLYNPFSGSTLAAFEPIGEMSLEGLPDTPFLEGLNDLVRAEAHAANVLVADVYPQFVGKAREYIARDLIHPNDAGYRVMADAVLSIWMQAAPAQQ